MKVAIEIRQIYGSEKTKNFFFFQISVKEMILKFI